MHIMISTEDPIAAEEAAPAPPKGKLYFDKPEGLELPAGTTENSEVELLATFLVEKDGQMCLKAVEGIPLGAPDEPAEDPDFVGAVEKGL